LLIIHQDSASQLLKPLVTRAATCLGDVLDAVPTAFAVGDGTNRFRIQSLIAEGGMGEADKAADELGGLRVALTTTRPEMDHPLSTALRGDLRG
jgi:hypothetical protein